MLDSEHWSRALRLLGGKITSQCEMCKEGPADFLFSVCFFPCESITFHKELLTIKRVH